MSNAIGTFGREAGAEVDYYLDRRLASMQWRSYSDERAWMRAASEFETRLASFRATAPSCVVQHRGRRIRTFRPLRRVASMAALAVLGLASMSASSAQAASPDMQSVEAQTSRLPAAANPQAAEANQRALAPAVKAAINAGDGKSLLESANPDVRGAALRYGNLTQRSIHSPKSVYAPPAGIATVKHRAHAAGCYGSPASEVYWTEFGQTIAWVYVRENGWCGSGGRITWLGGPTFADWSWGPFCLTGVGETYTWDGSTAWVHMAIWASMGNSYPWGCFDWSGGKAVLRIAWNGYFDYYNDYGF
jgi:hypothetical protein